MFRAIKTAVDAEDIEGLLAIGAPSDECNDEASLIEGAIAKAIGCGKRRMSIEDVERIISRVWNERFGPLSEEQLQQRSPAFRRIAQKLTAASVQH